MQHQDIFRYCVAGFLVALYLWFVSVISYAAWKDSKHGSK